MTRMRRAGALASVAVLSLGLAACGGEESSSGGSGGEGGSSPSVAADASFEPGTTMARLAEAGSINVGTKFDQPLFGLQGLSGQPEGFDVEIAKIIVGGLGISPENINWVETPSAIREEAIERGDADMVVATYTINDERAQRIDFAGPYYVAGQDLMVRSDNQDIAGPEDLRPTGARVCSVTGSTPAENILQYVDQSQLTLFDVYSKCADALRSNQVDAVTTDNVILIGLVEESDGAFKLVGNQFTDEPYGVGVPNNDVAFCEFVNEQLTQAAESGAYAEAWERTAGQVAENTPELPELQPCS